MKVALLTSAYRGSNAGDAFIENAIQRLVIADEFVRFSLIDPLTSEDIRSINQCDVAIICGTNLYQSRFTCNLDLITSYRIRIPIIPFGIGAGSPIGQLPKMSWLSRYLVKRLHRRVAKGSARDPHTLAFLKEIGVQNAMLTGCPVLFHSLRVPSFNGDADGKLAVSVRFRILHDHSSKLWDVEWRLLQQICKTRSPVLVAQSQHDLESIHQLQKDYGVSSIYSSDWQSEPYVDFMKEVGSSINFRLHFGMLALSYGKKSSFIAHDSRTHSFCEMMNIPSLILKSGISIRDVPPVWPDPEQESGFNKKWKELGNSMREFLLLNGVQTRLDSNILDQTQ